MENTKCDVVIETAVGEILAEMIKMFYESDKAKQVPVDNIKKYFFTDVSKLKWDIHFAQDVFVSPLLYRLLYTVVPPCFKQCKHIILNERIWITIQTSHMFECSKSGLLQVF